jgi:hypothetical protein
MARIERATSPLPRECSATELHGQTPVPSRPPCPCTTTRALPAIPCVGVVGARRTTSEHAGAGEGNRTLVVSLEGFCSTIELHPRRNLQGWKTCRYCLDRPAPRTHLPRPRSGLVEGEGFEPSKAEPADLQSAPFDRSGTPPNEIRNYLESLYWCQTFRETSARYAPPFFWF